MTNDSFDALVLSRNYIVAKRKRPPILIGNEFAKTSTSIN